MQLEPIANGDYSFWSLFMRSDWVIKGVMLILALFSVWSWVVAIDRFVFITTQKLEVAAIPTIDLVIKAAKASILALVLKADPQLENQTAILQATAI